MKIENSLTDGDFLALAERKDYCFLCDEVLPRPLLRIVLYTEFPVRPTARAFLFGQVGEFWPALLHEEDLLHSAQFYESHSQEIARHLEALIPTVFGNGYQCETYHAFSDVCEDSVSQSILDQFLKDSEAFSASKNIPAAERRNVRIRQGGRIIGVVDMRERLEVDLGDLRGYQRLQTLPSEKLAKILKEDTRLAATILETGINFMIANYYPALVPVLGERTISLRLDFRRSTGEG